MILASIFFIITILLGLYPLFTFFSNKPTSNLQESTNYIPNPDENANYTRLAELNDKRTRGGILGKDGIPAINLPQFITKTEADIWLEDSDIVFGLELNEKTIAFPRRILVWHEIVNTDINGSWISITYCPLTGTAIGYDNNLNGYETTFGTSGELTNSNLVMYDRLSGSFWPQILGQAIDGSSLGVKLKKIHVLWSTWGLWKNYYPETLVMSQETGRIRNYDADPYGSYLDNNSYYLTGYPIFHVQNYVPYLPDKAVVVGIEDNHGYMAIEKNLIRKNKLINFNITNKSFVAFHDSNLDVTRIFNRKIKGIEYNFRIENNEILDNQTNTVWSLKGKSSLGSLTPVTHYDAMWFAWIAFYPSSKLLKI